MLFLVTLLISSYSPRSTANPMTESKKSAFPLQVSRLSSGTTVFGGPFKRPRSDIEIPGSSKPPPWFSESNRIRSIHESISV